MTAYGETMQALDLAQVMMFPHLPRGSRSKITVILLAAPNIQNTEEHSKYV